MPKYTVPETLVNPTTITSNDWNKYFGSQGNLQWVYDEYENVSAINAVSIFNATVPAVAQNTVARVLSYQTIRGKSAFADIGVGVLTSPVVTGYVYLYANVFHNLNTAINSNTPIFYVQFIPLHQSISLLTTSFVSLKRRVDTNVNISPLVKNGSYGAIYHITGGFTRFQLGVYRTDAAITSNTFFVQQFSVLPLGDVSGLVNFIDNATVIE
jgi:hypothetical protein